MCHVTQSCAECGRGMATHTDNPPGGPRDGGAPGRRARGASRARRASRRLRPDNVLASLCMLLALLVAAWWVRSYFVSDPIDRADWRIISRKNPGHAGQKHGSTIRSSRGVFLIMHSRWTFIVNEL